MRGAGISPPAPHLSLRVRRKRHKPIYPTSQAVPDRRGYSGGDSMIDIHAPTKIRSMTCLDELAGYEAQAKVRGITGPELRALDDRRKQLEARK